MKVPRCRGSRDLSPDEMRRFRLIEGVFRKCLSQSGYREVRTPTVEYLHLFTMAGTLTPGRLNHVYSFLDWDGWSGERVVLRPDGTIPIARYCVENCSSKDLSKLFYITNIFIFEETGSQTRERWQGGAELIGAGSPLADLELITLAMEILNKLGFTQTEIRLSHVGMVRTLLAELGLKTEEQMAAFDRIMDGDSNVLAGLKPSRPELKRALSALLDLKGNTTGFLQNCKALFQRDLPQLVPHIDDLMGITSRLDTLGIRYKIDVTTGAGFEYYTGMAFKLFLGNEQVGGGGRYDALMPLVGGNPVPASGFALYLDRLMDRLPASTVEVSTKVIRLSFDSGDTAALRQGFDLATQLRQAGFAVELDMGNTATPEYQWQVTVHEKASGLTLSDSANRQKVELNTTVDLLTWLEEQGGNQAGLT